MSKPKLPLGLKFGAERLVRDVQHPLRRERKAARIGRPRIVIGMGQITSG
jgi:hypothetical protein